MLPSKVCIAIFVAVNITVNLFALSSRFIFLVLLLYWCGLFEGP